MAVGLLAKLLMTNQLKFENGLIELKDIHMTLVTCTFIGELTRYFYKEKKLKYLYLISWMWGLELVGQVTKDFHLDTPSKVYNLGMDLAEAMGSGLYKTRDYIAGRYTHFTIPKNPFLEYLTGLETTEPIDYYIAGCMAGGGCFVHQNLCQCIELTCMLKGDSNCDFLSATEKELRERGLWDEVMNRYSLDEIYPYQKAFYEAFSKNEHRTVMAEILNKILR